MKALKSKLAKKILSNKDKKELIRVFLTGKKDVEITTENGVIVIPKNVLRKDCVE